MKRTTPLGMALAGLLLLSGQGQAGPDAGPSFDCARARTQVERMVCATPRLSVLDAVLGRYYAAAGQSLPLGQRSCLAAEQRTWLATQRNACGSAACLERAYLLRLDALEGLLPGAAVDRRLEGYPDVAGARLLAVVPAAAGRDPGEDLEEVLMEGTPVEDEGGYLLVDARFDPRTHGELAAMQGDADAIRARFGDGPVRSPGVVGSFGTYLLDDRARAAIAAIAGGGGDGIVRVKGWAVHADAAPPALDPRRCAFVYAAAPR
ncbi:lysozyme inhibitor LprI family protein [Pseudoxanthomonas broegbernensis]|nr:lysozyme inhibitor LprI family protein [Pseudoxanthomonas broegbernensis]MBB6065558.1 uncharacterized protein YecT (DUF1311 family) [Pseudoxanthomonas broegbernensis]